MSSTPFPPPSTPAHSASPLLVHLLLKNYGSLMCPCLLESKQYEIYNSRPLTSSETGSSRHQSNDANDADNTHKALKSLKKTLEANGGSSGRGPE